MRARPPLAATAVFDAVKEDRLLGKGQSSAVIDRSELHRGERERNPLAVEIQHAFAFGAAQAANTRAGAAS